MGCETAVFTSSLNGLIIGLVVGITLSLVKSFEGPESISSLMKQMLPQCTLVGAVIGFSHSILDKCTGLLQPE